MSARKASMSQQSLLNRNTSPFNREISNSLGEVEQENKACSSGQMTLTDDTYKKMQTKIKQQAERLLQFQLQL